jgi:hypothetical protein
MKGGVIMNAKICKSLRKIAFQWADSKWERGNRRHVILEDKIGMNKNTRRMLLCLDPRAIYQMMKRSLKSAPAEKGLLQGKEIRNAAQKVRENIPRGYTPLSDRKPSFLGHDLDVQQG